MSRLNKENVTLELSKKGLIMAADSPDYKNLNSHIKVMCTRGHTFVTTLASVRLASFSCPVCVGERTKGFDEMPTEVPKKEGVRVLGIDNATYNMGVSLFDDGKLVFFKLIKFKSKDHVERLVEIRNFFEKEIIKNWQPDVIQFEDVQHQHSYAAYEVLIKLIGLLEITAFSAGLEFHKTRANVWRSHFGVNRRNRDADKKAAIDYVKKVYDINVSDDVAEAIMIGKYRCELMEKEELKSLF